MSFPCLGAVALLCTFSGILIPNSLMAGPAPDVGVLVEVVNDSDVPDTNVFLKVPGLYWSPTNTNTVSPSNLFVNLDPHQVSPDAASVPLASLDASGTLVSTVTGRTNTVRTFRVFNVKSGQVVVSFGKPFTFTGGKTPNPAPNQVGSDLRYDYAELSVEAGTNEVNNAIDLTYVDKFGIPLQLEWFKGSSAGGILANASYTYASTRTLVERFQSLGLSNAVFSLDGTNMSPGWQYSGPGSFSQFGRIIGPSKINAGTTDSVAPYPDARFILEAAVSQGGFAVNGGSPQGGYNYLGYTATITTNATGWLGTLSYDPARVPAHSTAILNGASYTNTLTFEFPTGKRNYVLYGAPVGVDFYRINGSGVPDSNSDTYAVETWMIGDVLSALNFGFVGGRFGTNSADWFSKLDWTHFPFGNARTTNDGLYNAYTALLYNATDGYGFAFSERITPGVLLNPLTGDTVRLTLLPDVMLDAPNPTVGAVGPGSVALHWEPVSDATGYKVSVLRPGGVAAVVTTNTSVTLTQGIQPGLTYVMTVQALGRSQHGNPLITPARPFQATTPGQPQPPTGDTPVVVSFNTADAFYSVRSVSIGGQVVSGRPGSTVVLNLSPGTHWIPFRVTGLSAGATNVLFDDYLEIALDAAGTAVVTNEVAGAWYSFYGPEPKDPGRYYWQFSTDPMAYTNASWFTQLDQVERFTNVYPAGATQRVPLLKVDPTLFGQDSQHGKPVVAFAGALPFTVWATNTTTGGGSTRTWTNQFGVPSNVQYPPLSADTYPNVGLVVGVTFSPTSSHRHARVVLPGARPPTFEEWVASFSLVHGDAQASADPDDDGDNNLLEYLEGRNPAVWDVEDPLGLGRLAEGGQIVVDYHFRRGVAVTGVLESFEWSEDLVNWQPLVVELGGVFPGPDPNIRHHRLRLPSRPGAVFLRTTVRDPQR